MCEGEMEAVRDQLRRLRDSVAERELLREFVELIVGDSDTDVLCESLAETVVVALREGLSLPERERLTEGDAVADGLCDCDAVWLVLTVRDPLIV